MSLITFNYRNPEELVTENPAIMDSVIRDITGTALQGDAFQQGICDKLQQTASAISILLDNFTFPVDATGNYVVKISKRGGEIDDKTIYWIGADIFTYTLRAESKGIPLKITLTGTKCRP